MSMRKKIYEALVDGAGRGLSGAALYSHVVSEVPKATSKKIVRASLLALSDPHLKDANILHVIYALAIKHRLDPASSGDSDDDDDKDGGDQKAADAAGSEDSDSGDDKAEGKKKRKDK